MDGVSGATHEESHEGRFRDREATRKLNKEAWAKRYEVQAVPVVEGEFKRLNATHLAVCRSVVAGMSNQQIADELGVSLATVKAVKSSPLGKAKIEEFMTAVNRRFTDQLIAQEEQKLRMRAKILDWFEEQLNDPEFSEGPLTREKIQLAEVIADRTGAPKLTKIEATSEPYMAQMERLKKLEQRAAIPILPPRKEQESGPELLS